MELHWLRNMVIDEIAFCGQGLNASADFLFFKAKGTEHPKERWSKRVEIFKTDTDKRIVYGWATVISKGGIPVRDFEGDCIEEAEMEQAAHRYLKSFRGSSDTHELFDIAVPVASVPMTLEVQKALGVDLGMVGWLVGFEVVSDDAWLKVKKGDLSMFSIGGYGDRAPIPEGTETIFKAFVSTTGDTNGHTHSLSFEDPPIASGTRRTGESDGHAHDVKIDRQLESGDMWSGFTEIADGHQHALTVNVPNIEKASGQPAITELPKLLSDFGVWDSPNRYTIGKAVSSLRACERSGNSGPFESFFPVMKSRVLRAWLRSNPGAGRCNAPAILKSATREWVAEVPQIMKAAQLETELARKLEKHLSEPRLFDEVIEDFRASDVSILIDDRIFALSISVGEILFHPETEAEGGDRDVEGLIAESVEQFASDMKQDLPGLFAGTIMKAFPKEAEVDSIAAWLIAALNEGDDMFTTDDQKAAFKKAWDRALEAGTAEDRILVLEAEAVELKKAAENKDPEPDPKPDDDAKMLKALPEAARVLVEKALKTASDADKSAKDSAAVIVTLSKAARSKEMREIAKALPHIAKSEDEMTDYLVEQDAAGKLDATVEILTTANAAASAAFDEIGTEITNDGEADADTQLRTIAKAYQTATPTLNIAKAYKMACDANPELLKEATEGAH